jgi:glycosyltransferase involved in cell wall biosynthesis
MSESRRACTIAPRMSLTKARVTVASFERQHPDVDFVTLITDGQTADRGLPGLGRVLLPSDLMPEREWASMAAIYDADEFAAALKPYLLAHLVGEGGSAVFLSPDTRVYADLAEVYEAAERTGLALTPQVLGPMPRDGRYPDERTIRTAGVFNLGLVGVSSRGLPFLRWWSERVRRDAVMDAAEELYGDQRWADWVPGLYPNDVLRDKGLNVGWWNLHERTISRDRDGRPHAGGRPLRTLRFDGWDPTSPWRLTTHDHDRPRVLLSEEPALAELCTDYSAELEKAGNDGVQDYGFARFPDGGEYSPIARRMYRKAVIAAEAKGQSVPPNPYLDTVRFRQWAFGYTPGSLFCRLDLAIWDVRPDLKVLMSDPEGTHAQIFARWLTVDPFSLHERERANLPLSQVPQPATPTPLRSDGWSVLAYAKAEFGVGEAGRRMAAAVGRIGCPYEVVGVVKTESRQQMLVGVALSAEVHYANTVTCVNADYMQAAWDYAGMAPSGGRRIGLWFWEVDIFPAKWAPIMNTVNEVWVTSDHTKKAIDALGSTTPVRVIPLPVVPPAAPTRFTRAMLGMPEGKTVFLCSYDFFSVVRRKNPLDTIAAYTRAFGPDDGAVLILKSINGHLRVPQLEEIRYRAAERPDILVMDGYLDAQQMQAMIELSDCVVSLHRCEAYGLNLIDAMAVGTPVVATGYSGNLAFMDERNSFLVPYDLVEVGPGSEPYEPHAHWAQPHVDAAATLLRTIVDNPKAAAERGAAGKESVLSRFSAEKVAAQLRPLLLDWTGKR